MDELPLATLEPNTSIWSVDASNKYVSPLAPIADRALREYVNSSMNYGMEMHDVIAQTINLQLELDLYRRHPRAMQHPGDDPAIAQLFVQANEEEKLAILAAIMSAYDPLVNEVERNFAHRQGTIDNSEANRNKVLIKIKYGPNPYQERGSHGKFGDAVWAGTRTIGGNITQENMERKAKGQRPLGVVDFLAEHATHYTPDEPDGQIFASLASTAKSARPR